MLHAADAYDVANAVFRWTGTSAPVTSAD